MSLSLRQNNVLTGKSGETDTATFANGYTVTAYSVGAVASAASSGSTATVDAGHSFGKGDKVLIYDGTTATFVAEAVNSVTATTVVWSTATPSISSGDFLVNLGPDTASGSTPNYDASRFVIYSDADGGSAVSNSRVTVDTTGNYAYYHKGDGRAWELILDASSAVAGLVRGWSAHPYRCNVQDFGAAGDGSADDAPAIQAANYAAMNAGGIVWYPPGTYLLDNATEASIQITDTCSHDGVRGKSIIKAGANGSFTGTTLCSIKTANDVTITNLYFDCDFGVVDTPLCVDIAGGGANNRITFRDCVFDGANTYGIACQNDPDVVNDLWVVNNKFIDCVYGVAVVSSSSTGIHIIDNSFNHPNVTAANMRNHINIDRDVTDITIRGNTCNKGMIGIAVASCTHVNITENIVRNNNGTNSNAEGIHLEYTTSEIALQHAVIANNIVYTTAGTGINVIASADGPYRDIKIIGNTVYGCTSGTASPAGIGMDDTQDGVIMGNTVHGCDGAGITVLSTNSNTNHVNVIGNVCFNNNQDASASGANINVGSNAADVFIDGNACYDDQGTPTVRFHIRAVPTDNSVVVGRNNRIDANAVTGAYSFTTPTLANDATPSVLNISGGCRSGGTTAITDFDDGVVGQQFTLKAEHSITITDNAAIELNGGGNFAMTSGDSLTLRMITDQVWTEVGRSNVA